MSKPVGEKVDASQDALPPNDDDDIEASMMFEDDDIDIGDDNDGNVLMVMSQASVVEVERIPEKPADDLVWDNLAIVNCWQQTLKSYRPNNETNFKEMPPTALTPAESEAEKAKSQQYFNDNLWTSPKLQRMQTDASNNEIVELLSEWKPKALPIPSWAIDPTECASALPAKDEAGE